uniref:RASD family member 2 n=1 Tax=Equus asinus TaxID=9793 RepID=A0A8C4MML3_EQUAS
AGLPCWPRHREPELPPLFGGTPDLALREKEKHSPPGEGGKEEPGPRRKFASSGGQRRCRGGGAGVRLTRAPKPWGGVQGPLPHARGAERPAPPSAAGVASRGERTCPPAGGELPSCGQRRRQPPNPPTRAGGEGSIGGQAGSPTQDTHTQSPPKDPPGVSKDPLYVPESPLPPSPYPRSPRRGPQHRTFPRLRAPGSAGVPRVGAGPGRRRRAGARPAPGPCRALGSRPWGSGSPIPRARPRPAWRLEPRAGGAGRSDPGDPADSRKRGGGGGRRGRRFLAPPGASRQPSEPCQRPGPPFPGDVFILVFSLDNRESFDEVKRLQKQILEVKSCLKNKTKEAAELPMVICGNKNDHGELCRQVPATEAELLVSGDENCAYFEVSAKKNTNVDEMFYVLFSMAKLPHEMSPALHRKISVQYGDAFHPRPFCMRRVKEMDAYGMVSPFARRPSVNSDLKYIKAKVLREGQARERDKCTIQ